MYSMLVHNTDINYKNNKAELGRRFKQKVTYWAVRAKLQRTLIIMKHPGISQTLRRHYYHSPAASGNVKATVLTLFLHK